MQGTKRSCGEGGCGACVLMLSRFDSASKQTIHIPVNSVSLEYIYLGEPTIPLYPTSIIYSLLLVVSSSALLCGWLGRNDDRRHRRASLHHVKSFFSWNLNSSSSSSPSLHSRQTSYNALQKTLAAYNGTQCGFCSPGFVMNMYRYDQRFSRKFIFFHCEQTDSCIFISYKNFSQHI